MPENLISRINAIWKFIQKKLALSFGLNLGSRNSDSWYLVGLLQVYKPNFVSVHWDPYIL